MHFRYSSANSSFTLVYSENLVDLDSSCYRSLFLFLFPPSLLSLHLVTSFLALLSFLQLHHCVHRRVEVPPEDRQ